VPGQPQYTTTGLYGGNDVGGLCGFVDPPPYTIASTFISRNGVVSLFQIEGSMNALGSAGVVHGWVMNARGVITVIEAPRRIHLCRYRSLRQRNGKRHRGFKDSMTLETFPGISGIPPTTSMGFC